MDTLKENFVSSFAVIEDIAQELKGKIGEERSTQILSNEEMASVKEKMGFNMKEMLEVFDKAIARKAEEV